MALVKIERVRFATDESMATITRTTTSAFRAALEELIAAVLAGNAVVIEAAEQAARDAVEQALLDAEIVTRPVLRHEYGVESVDAIPGTARVILNAAGQTVARIPSDASAIEVNVPVVSNRGRMVEVRPGGSGGHVIVGSNGRLSEMSRDGEGNFFQWALDRMAARMEGGAAISAPTRLVVRPNPGVGEYASPKAANEAATGGSPSRRFLIDVYPGTYTDIEWTVNPYVTIRGRDRDTVILAGAQPDDSGNDAIRLNSTLWLTSTATLENLTVTARNMRYPIHSESSGAVTDYVHRLHNVRVVHEGNQGARDWRLANPGSGLPAGEVSTVQRPWGHGASSGGEEHFEQVTFESYDANAWYVHTNRDWANPARYTLRHCTLISRVPDGVIAVEPIGSGVESTLEISDSTFGNVRRVNVRNTLWLSLTHFPADQHEVAVSIGGMHRLGFDPATRGRALVLTAVSTSETGITVSGTGAVIVGQYRRVRGGTGLPAQAWGWPDVSGALVGAGSDQQVNNTLGRLLGDCSTVSKTLTVTVGEGSRSVILGSDYRETSNADILAELNSALAGLAVASIEDPMLEFHYPRFPDREMSVPVAAGIRRGEAVKLVNGQAQKMQPSDPVSQLAGVAVSSAAPGDYVRVITRGLFDYRGLDGITSPLTDGQTVYLSDSVPGRFSVTGTRAALDRTFAGYAEL